MCLAYLVKLKLYVPVGNATVLLPIGPILNQYGINMLQFCKDFNEKTIELKGFIFEENDLEKKELVIPIYVCIYHNKTFYIKILKPSVVTLLTFFVFEKKKINYIDLVKLAKFKFPKLKLYSALKIIRGITRSLKIEIIKNEK